MIRRWSVLAVLVVGSVACRPASPALLGEPRIDRGADAPRVLEGMFAAGRYGEVVTLSTQTLERARDRELVAHLRFLRAMARLSQHSRSDQSLGLAELRELELSHRDLVWGRMAELYVAETTRANVLHESMLAAGVELRTLQDRVRALELALAEAKTNESHRQGRLAAAENDREQLQKQLDDVQAKAAAHVRRIGELEEELAALKRIDMLREP